MKKLLIINDLGKIIHFKNKDIRTPVQIEATDNEIKQLQITLHMIGVKDYIIKKKSNLPIKKIKNIPIEKLILKNNNHDDNDMNPKSILKKLINKEL